MLPITSAYRLPFEPDQSPLGEDYVHRYWAALEKLSNQPVLPSQRERKVA